MRNWIGFVVILGGLLAAPGPALAVFTYKVVGVAADDRLNVRKNWPGTPGYRTVVGSFGPRATGIVGTGRSFDDNGQRWFEVRVGGKTGWANGKFLEDERSGFPKSIWSRMKCGGTEPFWDVGFGKTRARYITLGGPDLGGPERFLNITRKPGASDPSIQGYRLEGERDGQMVRMTAIVAYKPWCSDGMSNYDYGFMILLWPDDPGAGILSGCCSLTR